MRTQRLLLFLLYSATFFFLQPTTTADPADDGSGGADFIRTSCSTTLYPDVCHSSLSKYANAVQQNPGQLARFAIAVTLSNARRVASYISNLTHAANYEANSPAASALHGCFSNLGDAVDGIRDSMKQMRRIGAAGAGNASFRFQMSNVQTYMSAALTDEGTCTDGFEDVPDSPVKTGVCNQVTNLKKFTSNALALVNSYANKGTS